jgi:hypothetical protein
MRVPNQLGVLLAPRQTPLQTGQAEGPDHEPVLQERRGGLLRGTQGGVDGSSGGLLGLSFLNNNIGFSFTKNLGINFNKKNTLI